MTITATAGDKQATCKVTVQKKVVAVASVSLSQTAITLYEGQSTTLVATVKPDNATNKTVTWSSSASEIASVDQEGKVSAIKAGIATITAKAGEKQATCKVTVQEKPKVSSISFNTNSFNGYIGSDYPVSVSVPPENAQYDLEWKVSDSRVASIQGDGTSARIHTKDYGIAEIVVTDKISGKTASITISTSVSDFVWTENTGESYSGYPLITIEEGQDYQLHYTCSPSSATKLFSDLSQFVFYEPNVVSAPTCISISEDGIVHGVKEGVVGIKATGRIIKASTGAERVYIKVKAATVPVLGISLNKSALSLKEGESETLTATISPSNATNKSAYWSSNRTWVASVDQYGKVTAIGEGTATITASAGNYSASCTVTVEKNVIAVTSITLNKSSISLLVGETETLIATVLPTDATNKTITWSSSNTAVATVSSGGVVTAWAAGVATITASAGDKTASCLVTVTQPSSGPEAVDLGLSVKWATYNVGATKPEEYGDYFAWGEISPKNDYSWATYRWCNGYAASLTKYNTKTGYGTVDRKTTLELSDDAAHANWGGKWRMPTKAEFDELESNCTWSWTTQGGTEGYKVTSKKNGNSIFLPAAGLRRGSSADGVGSNGNYWSSSLYTDLPYSAWFMFLDSGDHSMYSFYRYYGRSVRPVSGDLISVTSVSLSQTSLFLMVGGSAALTATVYPSNASDKTVTWTSSNTSVATVSNGTVTAKAAGTATITATADGKSATCTVTVTQPQPEAVDLGLSVKWASYNVGASKPEEYGDYYAWGETEPKKNYSWSTYKWGTSETSLTKYNTNIYRGTVDNKTVLEPEDDVAHVKLGGKWRMPTDAEWTELSTKCTWTWVTNYNGSGINGRLVKATNGNSIFLPAAGSWYNTGLSSTGDYGGYWSSSLGTDGSLEAWLVSFHFANVYMGSSDRCGGRSVRPVTE